MARDLPDPAARKMLLQVRGRILYELERAGYSVDPGRVTIAKKITMVVSLGETEIEIVMSA